MSLPYRNRELFPVIKAGAHPRLGHPWGWGAVVVRAATKNEECADCGPRRTRAKEVRHVMPDGRSICTGCARARCEANGLTLKE